MKNSMNRVYGYFDDESIEFLQDTKTKLNDDDCYISISKLILFAVKELEETADYESIKQKLRYSGLIR